ncbi:MAG: glycosyl transferase family 3, partial [Rhodospirillales bacterium]|nr:glycosyl transferase family 3 [Rhodospirillales bacterium]
PVERFAEFVATLGRGPGRSRALTRDEAREAFGLVLDERAEPVQIGAFLMLLRYRGEDSDEIAGLVEAARERLPRAVPGAVDLDWPSYGAGRTRDVPWFLLAALALARSGIRVAMHGSNRFSSGPGVADALHALGREAARDYAQAQAQIAENGFAYLPIELLSAKLDELLELRRKLGLRSPVNTVARLLDPFDAAASVDGVFHPPYIDVHLGVAQRLQRKRLLVVKGAGGEAERAPTKAVAAGLFAEGVRRDESFAALLPRDEASPGTLADLAATWRGEAEHSRGRAVVIGTIALALRALGHAADPDSADEEAARLWARRG